MNKEWMKQWGEDITRDAIRQEKLIHTAQALECLPELLDSVAVDKKQLLSTIEDELNRPTANPLNILLRLFGLRIIHKDTTIRDIDDGLDDTAPYRVAEADDGDLTSLLRIDETVFRKAVDGAAHFLSEAEREANSAQEYLKKQNAALHAELDKKENECRQLSADRDGMVHMVAERAQYMLYLCGRDGSIAEQVNDLLDDMEMRAAWETEVTESEREKYFTQLKCADPEKRRGKPCILAGDAVVLKGVIFRRNISGD